jgi:hypothetical protein
MQYDRANNQLSDVLGRISMLNEEQVKLTAQIAAIEHLLINLHVQFYRIIGVPFDQLPAIHGRAIELLKKETFQGASPEVSDLFASELEAAVDRLLSAVGGIGENSVIFSISSEVNRVSIF